MDRSSSRQIGVLGSECLDRRSYRRAWIGDRESGSALVVDRRAWIGVLLAVLGSETERVDRRLWRIGVLGLAFFLPCLDRSSSHRAWIGDRESGSKVLLGVVLLARIGDRESGSEFFSAPCSLLGSKVQNFWNREE